MILDSESYRVAIGMIAKVGDNASLGATLLANGLSAQGDRDGFLIWTRIAKAINELQRTRRAQGEPLN